MLRTTDSMSLVHKFPDTPPDVQGRDDDVVASHGKDVRKFNGKYYVKGEWDPHRPLRILKYRDMVAALCLFAAFFLFSRKRRQKQISYTKIPACDTLSMGV